MYDGTTSDSFDYSRFPLVVITTGANPDAEMEGDRAKIRALLGRQQRHGVLIDLRQAARPSPKQRQQQADFLKENAAAVKQYTVGMAFVIDKALVRGAFTAISWLQPPPVPYSIEAKFDDAEAWVIARLTAVGLQVPRRPGAVISGRTG